MLALMDSLVGRPSEQLPLHDDERRTLCRASSDDLLARDSIWAVFDYKARLDE